MDAAAGCFRLAFFIIGTDIIVLPHCFAGSRGSSLKRKIICLVSRVRTLARAQPRQDRLVLLLRRRYRLRVPKLAHRHRL